MVVVKEIEVSTFTTPSPKQNRSRFCDSENYKRLPIRHRLWSPLYGDGQASLYC